MMKATSRSGPSEASTHSTFHSSSLVGQHRLCHLPNAHGSRLKGLVPETAVRSITGRTPVTILCGAKLEGHLYSQWTATLPAVIPQKSRISRCNNTRPVLRLAAELARS
ncbi:unnamed protein product [Symbiodinium natans]|uniref:Uncharacterized protein n=1 Tax=Symbiodinium natans TaxID=878477 RepID=A0A812RYA7_9DINO|nr:unnamed protein product [Symbiodinium natans]